MSSVRFSCPACGAEGSRALPFPLPGSETLTVPSGHEIRRQDGKAWMACFASGVPDLWPIALPPEPMQ